LASTAKPNAWERLTRIRCNSPRRCATLLWLFAAAVRAELEGLWQRADFFFNEAAADFGRLSRDTSAWVPVAGGLEEPTAELTKHPEKLRECLVDEHFIDTHIALFNGYAAEQETLDAGNRAFTHLARLQALLPASSLSPAQHHALLQPPLERLAAAHESAKQWDGAIEAIETLVALAPEEVGHQDRLIDLVFAKALTNIKASDNETVNRQQADMLRRGIGDLEKLRSRFADNAKVYENLAVLRHLRGVKLANAGAFSDALLEVRKALILLPSFSTAIETWKQLVEAVKNLQKHVAEMEAKIKSQPNLTLNQKGLQMRKVARIGFKEVAAYAESDEAAQLAAAAVRARNRSLWRSIGLPEPASDWDKRAADLLVAMNKVAATQPADRGAIVAEWENVRAASPELSLIDSELVCRFLTSRLLEEPKAPALEPQPPPAESESSAPLLHVSKAKRQGGVPFSFWLTSPVDLVMKFSWATALLLVVVAAAVHVGETKRLQQRAKAYAALSAAKINGDHRAALKAAEDFLEVQPSAKDGREPEVSAIAAESLVRWMTQQTGEASAADQHLIDRFRQLMPESSNIKMP
jgi:tetratricopeptide (TPR) repeat protein